jgi:threonine synthase
LYATGLKCVKCGTKFPTNEKSAVCPRCEGLFEIEYDYGSMHDDFSKSDLGAPGALGLWRYAKALPVRAESIVTLGEGFTPLVETKKLVSGVKLMAKLDYVMPTSSFKDRGSTVAVSKAKELKVNAVAIDSTGNAAASLSAYAAKAGIPCYVFVPFSTEPEKVVQMLANGAKVVKVKGTRQDTHDVIEEAYRKYGWYYCGFMVSPYAIEGTKTIAYEICEQMNWEPPDWVVFPVGTGSGIVGCAKGMQELHRFGWIDRIPRLVCIQAEGCAPISNAYKKGEDDIIPVKAPHTVAEGLAVGAPPKGSLVLEALRKTGGLAEVVTDDETIECAKALAAREGLYVEISAAPSIAGVIKLLRTGVIEKGDTVVCELTGTGLKSSREYSQMVQAPLEIEPSLESLVRALREWTETLSAGFSNGK